MKPSVLKDISARSVVPLMTRNHEKYGTEPEHSFFLITAGF